MEGAIKNLAVLLIELVVFSLLISLYVGYKKSNNFFGLAVFIFCMVIVAFLTYTAKLQLLKDFHGTAYAETQARKQLTPDGRHDLETVKRWIEWQIEINKERNKKIPQKRRFIFREDYKV